MARRLSKNDRVLALMGAFFALSMIVGALVYALTVAQAQGIDAKSARLATLRAAANDLVTDIHEETSALDAYVLSRSQLALDRHKDAAARELATEERLAGTVSGPLDVDESFEGFAAATQEWRSRVAAPAITAVSFGDASLLRAFSDDAAIEYQPIVTAIREMEQELDRASADILSEQASVDLTTNAGIAVAFGFVTIAFVVALVAVRRFGRALETDAQRSRVLNRFTEVASFATDDREVAAANLVALGRLVTPDAAVSHILNRSLDRAVAEASFGAAVVAETLPLHALDRCAGIVRGSMYVSDDLSDDLTVHCPVYPAAQGTLACIPLASGETVGAVHLYWRRPWALPLELRPTIARIAEHASLAIGNRRLMAALYGQANTDPRTGLANSRSFDDALEMALAARTGSETVAILMVDIDDFKHFNDRHGHPAGDEALRAFAGVLASCMRERDLAARYGGEEFAVLLPGTDATAVATIAERIRERTEETVVMIGSGVTDHITVSIGVAIAPIHGTDRATLLRLADEALYQAKEAGRNRVVVMTDRRLSGPLHDDPPSSKPRLVRAAVGVDL